MDGIITLNQNGGLNFGGFAFAQKQKQDGFTVNGDVYKIKTHNEITRLEKNDALLFETTPGVLVDDFQSDAHFCAFSAKGSGDTQITIELLPETNYRVIEDEVSLGDSKTNKTGKITFSAELSETAKKIKVEKL